MKGRFSEEQIIGLLKQQEAGATVAQLCRDHNVSQGAFYKWEAKFGGMNVSEAKRLKQLGDENAKLKRLYSQRRACRLTKCNCKSARHTSACQDDAQLRGRLCELAYQRKRWGYRLLNGASRLKQ